jgi:2-keto-3-deoxy-L-fuconate dehydrogenase
MMGRLHGRRALVTAAGAGIGRAIALAFAEEGALVVATDVDAAALARLSAEHSGITTRTLDVTDAQACAGVMEEAGETDVLVNAAGFVAHGTILDCGEDEWRRSFDLNVTSMYRLCRLAIPGFVAQGHGSIVNIASVVSSLKAAPDRFVYAATKAAVIGLTKAIAVDFVAKGVRANAICPGTVDTPSLAGRIAAFDDPAAARARFIARQPMGRFGTAEEVAALAVHLAAPESAFTTGQAFVIDGGMSL